MLHFLLLPLAVAPAQFTEFTARSAWEAAAGSFQTIDFTGFQPGDLITTQYQAQGVTFPQGNETIRHAAAFIRDGEGVDGNGDVELLFASPQLAVGADYPGSLRIDLYSGSNLLYSSSSFGGGGTGTGNFAGVVSTLAFDRVVLSDWSSGFLNVDDVSWSGSPLVATLTGTCPGSMTLNLSGATPSGGVALVYAQGLGSLTVPPGFACAGTVLGLDSTAQLLLVLTAGPAGTAVLTRNVPAGACGGYLQAVDVATCTASNVVPIG